VSVPTVKDRAMQALYLLALDPVAETIADPNSYGFRKERATADAIEQCHTILSRKYGAQWVLEGDIQACFERISHSWLETHIPTDTGLLHKWLTAGVMEHHVLQPTVEGSPQGGILSPVLANLALDGLEKRLREKYPAATPLSPQVKVNLVRYADDFIVTGSSAELLAHEVKPLVEQFLQERGLHLSPEKTRITHITTGFDFLGHHIRRYRKSVLVTPARAQVAAFLGKVRTFIKAHKQAPAGHLIGQLNPLIRGWAHYHRHGASKRTLTKVDNAIFLTLWQWAKRRHPQKSPRWIKQKYFQTVGGKQWVFFGTRTDKRGRSQTVRLFAAASVPITRHVKVKGAANPYDPAWASYFAARRHRRIANALKGNRMLLALWQEQDGCCLLCHQEISELSGWHKHHLQERSQGGRDEIENCALLHPTCHQQVHSRGLSVVKPRSSQSVGKA
jgi:RNA-directed DNA polymerase